MPPGHPTVDRAGPLLPALDTNITLCLSTSSFMSSIIRLQHNKEQKLNKHNLHILKWICFWGFASGVQGNLSLTHQTLQLMWQEVFCLTFLVVIIITTIVTDIVIIIIIFIVVIIIIMNVTAQKETKGFILPWIRPMTCFSVAHIYKITFVLMNCNQLKQNSLNKKST